LTFEVLTEIYSIYYIASKYDNCLHCFVFLLNTNLLIIVGMQLAEYLLSLQQGPLLLRSDLRTELKIADDDDENDDECEGEDECELASMESGCRVPNNSISSVCSGYIEGEGDTDTDTDPTNSISPVTLTYHLFDHTELPKSPGKSPLFIEREVRKRNKEKETLVRFALRNYSCNQTIGSDQKIV